MGTKFSPPMVGYGVGEMVRVVNTEFFYAHPSLINGDVGVVTHTNIYVYVRLFRIPEEVFLFTTDEIEPVT